MRLTSENCCYIFPLFIIIKVFLNWLFEKFIDGLYCTSHDSIFVLFEGILHKSRIIIVNTRIKMEILPKNTN